MFEFGKIERHENNKEEGKLEHAAEEFKERTSEIRKNGSQGFEKLHQGVKELHSRDSLEQVKKDAKLRADKAWNYSVYRIEQEDLELGKNLKNSLAKVEEYYRNQMPENNLEALKISERMNRDLKDAPLPEKYAVASYIVANQLGLEHVNQLSDKVLNQKLEGQIKEAIDKIYSTPETMNQIRRDYGVTGEEVGKVKEDLVEKSIDTGKSILYLNQRLSLGLVSPVERAIRTVYGSEEFLTGDKEHAAEIMQDSKIEEFKRTLDQELDQNKNIQTAGNVLEIGGELISKMGITILSIGAMKATIPSVVAITVANSILAMNAGGESLEGNIARTGEFNNREFVSAIISAAATVVVMRVVPRLNNVVAKNASPAHINEMMTRFPKVEDQTTVKISSALSKACVGETENLAYLSQEKISRYTDYALGLEKNISLKGEAASVLESIATDAAFSAAGGFAGNRLLKSGVVDDALEQGASKAKGVVEKNLASRVDDVAEDTAKTMVEKKATDVIEESMASKVDDVTEGAAKAVKESIEEKAEDTAEKEIKDKGFDKLAKSWKGFPGNIEKFKDSLSKYEEDIRKYSEFPETLPEKLIDSKKLEKISPEQRKLMHEEFESKKYSLRKQWEETNHREWPRYENDIYITTESGGKIILRKAGQLYDMHHIQPLGLGGKNEVSNITPISADLHQDHHGIHATGTPYDQLVKMLGESK